MMLLIYVMNRAYVTSKAHARRAFHPPPTRARARARAATAGAPAMPAPDLATLSSLIEAVPAALDQT